MNTIRRHCTLPGCEPQGGEGRGCCVQVGDAQEEKDGAQGRDRVRLQGRSCRFFDRFFSLPRKSCFTL